jgi:hypothetical protein
VNPDLDRVMNWTITVSGNNGESHHFITYHAESPLTTPMLNHSAITITNKTVNAVHDNYGILVYILAFFALAVALLTDPNMSFVDLAVKMKKLLSELLSSLADRLLKDRS